jgi:hypothetical protein
MMGPPGGGFGGPPPGGGFGGPPPGGGFGGPPPGGGFGGPDPMMGAPQGGFGGPPPGGGFGAPDPMMGGAPGGAYGGGAAMQPAGGGFGMAPAGFGGGAPLGAPGAGGMMGPGARGEMRNPMNMLLFSLCAPAAIFFAWKMLNELKDFTRDEQFNPILMFVPVLGIYFLWFKVPEQVNKAKQMAGSRVPQSQGFPLYLLFNYALAKDLNQIWDPNLVE